MKNISAAIRRLFGVRVSLVCYTGGYRASTRDDDFFFAVFGMAVSHRHTFTMRDIHMFKQAANNLSLAIPCTKKWSRITMDDTLVVTPEYRLLIIMRAYTQPPIKTSIGDFSETATFSAVKGVLTFSGCGYPFNKYGQITINDVAEDYTFLTLTFDGETLTVPVDKYVSTERQYTLTDYELRFPPTPISARNKRLFGNYAKEQPTPIETVTVSFRLYRLFEDKWQEAYYYLKQAEAGNLNAQFIIANMLYHGRGIRKSRKEAREWLEKAKKASGIDYASVTADAYGWWVSHNRGDGFI